MKKANAKRPAALPERPILSALPERRPLVDEFIVAERLGVHVSWVRKSRMLGWREGKTPPPPYIRIGRAIRYDLNDLEVWIASNRVESKEIVEE